MGETIRKNISKQVLSWTLMKKLENHAYGLLLEYSLFQAPGPISLAAVPS